MILHTHIFTDFFYIGRDDETVHILEFVIMSINVGVVICFIYCYHPHSVVKAWSYNPICIAYVTEIKQKLNKTLIHLYKTRYHHL